MDEHINAAPSKKSTMYNPTQTLHRIQYPTDKVRMWSWSIFLSFFHDIIGDNIVIITYISKSLIRSRSWIPYTL